MKLQIKNMVSLRCKFVVQEALKKLNIDYTSVELGTIEISSVILQDQYCQLKEDLFLLGLEVMDNKREILIEKIKNIITGMIHYCEDCPKVNYSDYISKQLNYDYTYLSNIFAEVKGITIQQFIMNHKVERIKELMSYGELNLTEIAYKLHYSSVAHLPSQFKKVTGYSPSFYKKMRG